MKHKTKQLKHLKTFKVYPNLTPFGAYHKHRQGLEFVHRMMCNYEILTVSKYKHRKTKDYFYRVHGRYWLTFINNSYLEQHLITGTLKNLMAQYWKLKDK